MSFSIPPQWEPDPNDLKVEGTLQGDSLTGTMTMPNGKTYSWTGKRAPRLHRDKEPQWGTPIKLFDGKNMNEWHATGDNQWIVDKGILRSPHSGSNLVTNRTFNDFKLHIEFRYPKESNSGVYLRGRYEVQVIDSKGMEPSSVLLEGSMPLLSITCTSYLPRKSTRRCFFFGITKFNMQFKIIKSTVGRSWNQNAGFLKLLSTIHWLSPVACRHCVFLPSNNFIGVPHWGSLSL